MVIWLVVKTPPLVAAGMEVRNYSHRPSRGHQPLGSLRATWSLGCSWTKSTEFIAMPTTPPTFLESRSCKECYGGWKLRNRGVDSHLVSHLFVKHWRLGDIKYPNLNLSKSVLLRIFRSQLVDGQSQLGPIPCNYLYTLVFFLHIPLTVFKNQIFGGNHQTLSD